MKPTKVYHEKLLIKFYNIINISLKSLFNTNTLKKKKIILNTNYSVFNQVNPISALQFLLE